MGTSSFTFYSWCTFHIKFSNGCNSMVLKQMFVICEVTGIIDILERWWWTKSVMPRSWGYHVSHANDYLNCGLVMLFLGLQHYFLNFILILDDIAGRYMVGDSVTVADLCLPSILYNARRWEKKMGLGLQLWRILLFIPHTFSSLWPMRDYEEWRDECFTLTVRGVWIVHKYSDIWTKRVVVCVAWYGVDVIELHYWPRTLWFRAAPILQ